MSAGSSSSVIIERDGSLILHPAAASPLDRQNLIHGCLSFISPPEVFSILLKCLCVVHAYERVRLLDRVLYTHEQPVRVSKVRSMTRILGDLILSTDAVQEV